MNKLELVLAIEGTSDIQEQPFQGEDWLSN